MAGKKMFVDPPSGWIYGFPKVVPVDILKDEEQFKEWLIANGFPKKNVELALKYSRYWEESCDE
jgi:hypothetical protein